MRDFAFVFSGRTHIDQWFAGLALRERFIGKGPNLLVEAFLRHRVIRLRIFWNISGHWPLFCFPFVAAAVQDFHFFMSEQPERPERVACPPIRLITIKNAGRFGRDAVLAAELGEFFRRDIIADHRVL